jgi:thiazole synthase
MFSLGGVQLKSRLILGTALYPSPQVLADCVKAGGVEVITVALKRQAPERGGGTDFWEFLKGLGCHLLPNTAGCRTAKDAIVMARLAREVFGTNWIKLEVIGDDYSLQPDPFELVEAAKVLVAEGFEVFPYCTDDYILCCRLVEAGCRILMPWGAPIGSGQGIVNPRAITVLRERLQDVTLIVDAGLGAPSHAASVMELGYDGVLLNSAVALAQQPVMMAEGFAKAVEAGRHAYKAGIMPAREMACPSTPLLDTPFWHQEEKTT